MTNEERQVKLALFKDYVRKGKHRQGLKTFKEIARELGVSKGTAAAWLKEHHPKVHKRIMQPRITVTHPKLQYEEEEAPPPGWAWVD